MNRTIKLRMNATNKPYGGHIHQARFYTMEGPEFEGKTEFEFCSGNLSDDPRNRFGKLGNIGMRTSYIVNKNKNLIETRNTIYGYTELE